MPRGPRLTPAWASALSAALLVTSPGQAADGRLRPGRYCAREILYASSSRGQDSALGEFRAKARIVAGSGGLTFRFTNSMPDSGQILDTGTVTLHRRSGGGFSFVFADNWGARGHGLVKTRGQGIDVGLERDGLSGGAWGQNSERNYGDFTLQRAPCAAPQTPTPH